MNSQIKNKQLKTDSDDGKNHQAYFMELSRLKKAKGNCFDNKDCTEYNSLGGDIRYNEIEPLVKRTQIINHNKKKIGMDAGLENQFQKKEKGTEVGLSKITKNADHTSSSVKDKIMTNSQALNEEILQIKYLIKYMNNNNKQINN